LSFENILIKKAESSEYLDFLFVAIKLKSRLKFIIYSCIRSSGHP